MTDEAAVAVSASKTIACVDRHHEASRESRAPSNVSRRPGSFRFRGARDRAWAMHGNACGVSSSG